MMYAADSTGIIHGNLNLADILFLVAAIVFFVAAFLYTQLTPKPVSHIMATRLGPSLTLLVPWLILSTLIAIGLALAVAYVRGSLTDRAVMIVCTIGLSISILVYIIVFQYFFAYKLGAWLLNVEPTLTEVPMSFEWLGEQFARIWRPLVLGSLVCGVVSGFTAYVCVRVGWRIRVVRRWRNARHVRCCPGFRLGEILEIIDAVG
jgi:uncharacterized protein (DUF2062 family)